MSPHPTADRAQSSPIGFALVVALVVGAVLITITFGAAALTDAQGESSVARAEQTMTLFDSQTAQVALGDSSVYTVDLGGTQGTYEVDPSAGSMSIVQTDCDDDGTNGVDDEAYLMAPVELGRVTYTSGSTTIAYEGGGVWRQSADGEPRMVSPPEFHYRGATLTLPVILTRGSGAGSGPGTRARVTDGSDPIPVFPRAGSFPSRCDQTADGEDEPYDNPIADGQVYVQVESEYARAWGEYFETRTEGDVTYPDDDVVRVDLVSLTQLGPFEMPGEGGSVPVSGASGEHSVEEFTLTLRPDDADSANFNNLQWSMYAEEGDQRLEIHLRKSGSGGCSGGSTSITADATVYYSDDGGDTYQGWHADDAFAAACDDLDGDGSDEIYMEVDLVDDEGGDTGPADLEPGDPRLQYVDDSEMDSLVYFKVNGGDTVDPTATFDGHSVSWESKSYDVNTGDAADRESIDRIVRHYFAEFPEEFDLTVDDKNSDTIDEAGSSGRLFTGGSDRYVTFLHVTQNEVVVEIE